MSIKDKVQKRFEVFEFNNKVITSYTPFTLPAGEMKQLLTHIKDLEESCDGYALHLEQVCEDLYNLKAENKRLREELDKQSKYVCYNYADCNFLDALSSPSLGGIKDSDE